jgi:hypothetical protein
VSKPNRQSQEWAGLSDEPLTHAKPSPEDIAYWLEEAGRDPRDQSTNLHTRSWARGKLLLHEITPPPDPEPTPADLERWLKLARNAGRGRVKNLP